MSPATIKKKKKKRLTLPFHFLLLYDSETRGRVAVTWHKRWNDSVMRRVYLTFGEFGEKGSPTSGMDHISSPPVKQVGTSAKKCLCKQIRIPLSKSPLLLLSPYTLNKSRAGVLPCLCVLFLTADSIFQTGDDHSDSSCVTTHREATLSKQLWQASGASRTRCLSC